MIVNPPERVARVLVQFLTHVDKYNGGEVAKIDLATAVKLQAKGYARILQEVQAETLAAMPAIPLPAGFTTAPAATVPVLGTDVPSFVPGAPATPATFPDGTTSDELGIPRRKK